MSQPFLFFNATLLPARIPPPHHGSTDSPRFLIASFFNMNCGQPVHRALAIRRVRALERFAPGMGSRGSIKLLCMAVTIELQNLGDTQLSKEIRARVEHALSDKPGDWRVSITGSRGSEAWEMKIEGPNGFESVHLNRGRGGA